MANNTPKSSSKLRDSLKDIPDNLFDKDPNQEVKVYLLQKQFQNQPETLITLIIKMLKG
jgi:hypothetical protein